MRNEYRIYGMVICLIIVIFCFVLLLTKDPLFIDLAALLVMFVGGYGLRETLEPRKE